MIPTKLRSQWKKNGINRTYGWEITSKTVIGRRAEIAKPDHPVWEIGYSGFDRKTPKTGPSGMANRTLRFCRDRIPENLILEL